MIGLGAVYVVTSVLVGHRQAASRRSRVGAAMHGAMWVLIGAGFWAGSPASDDVALAIVLLGVLSGLASVLVAGSAPWKRLGDPAAWRGAPAHKCRYRTLRRAPCAGGGGVGCLSQVWLTDLLGPRLGRVFRGRPRRPVSARVLRVWCRDEVPGTPRRQEHLRPILRLSETAGC
jgi:hypothetical protein